MTPARAPLRLAATAPRTSRIGPPRTWPETVRMLAGELTDRGRIRAHVARFLAHHAALVERAAGAGARLVVLTEDTLRLVPFLQRHRRQRLAGLVLDEALELWQAQFGELCRRHGLFLAGGTCTHRAGRHYNTALILDPAGRVVARYDKTHIPHNGEHRCLTPGDELPVFDLPCGRVGLLICWDILFPEAFATLALKGADIVLQPTFGHAAEWNDVMARCRAMDWSVPLAISMWGGHAGIIDAAGEFVARTGRGGDTIAIADLDLRARAAPTPAPTGRPPRADPRTAAATLPPARQLIRERRPQLYRRLDTGV